ncbi:MAG: response regulator [Candidatus Omnitrophota bacterium]
MKKKILVIDDNPEIGRLVQDMADMIAEKAGVDSCLVVIAKGGEEGLNIVVQEDPDLILLDIKMQKMDGYTVLKELRSRDVTRSIPVIIITGYEKMQELFKSEGVGDFITKPFKAEEFLKKIAHFLREKK